MAIDPVAAVTRILTSTTTAWLPEPWQGDYDRERAETWLNEGDVESVIVAVLHRQSVQMVGLAILHDAAAAGPSSDVELRFGYVIEEAWWGRGLATELIGGLVEWARAQPSVSAMSGGVAIANAASARVLEKHGFGAGQVHQGERDYRRDFDRLSDDHGRTTPPK